MKKEEVPQDKSNLASGNLKEMVYAVDEKGEYTTTLSTGWDPKTIALDNASYVGFWQWRVKRHLKPKVFKKLSEKTLQKYADVFEISLNELKHIDAE